jgi:opacity protein-like surface antigen
MWKMFSAALAGAALIPCAAANAQETAAPTGKYISLSGGYVGESDFDYGTPASGVIPAGAVRDVASSGSSFAAAYGSVMGQNLRWELGVSRRSQDVDGSVVFPAPRAAVPLTGDKVTATSFDFAVFYDFPTGGPVRPYIGGVAGLAQIDIQDGLINDDAATAKVAAVAGVSVAAGRKASLFVDARYERLGTMSLEVTNGAAKQESKFSVGGLVVTGGLRFNF